MALALLALAFAWCAQEEDELPPSSEPVLLALPPMTEALPETHVDEPPPPDASVVEAPIDAGLPPLPMVADRREPNVDDYMRRWREALAPLFRTTRTSPGAVVLRAMPRESAETPDAGVEPCKSKVERLTLKPKPRIDLVVVVDTSGSMYRALPSIARWLAELELKLVTSRPDAQLLVVAEQQEISLPTKRDGGAFNAYVGSSDALDVLLDGSRPGRARWVDALRSNADVHIVVVTDDEARGKAPDYFARLTELLGGARFFVHLLGGLDTPKHGVLLPGQPLTEKTCRGEAIGLEPGVVYQELARLTNGLRAPFCSAASRSTFTEELLKAPAMNATCAWLVNSPGHRIDGVDAVGLLRAPTRLLQERVASNCYGTRRSYRLEDPLLVLCEDTCTALKAEGYEAIEVRLDCRR